MSNDPENLNDDQDTGSQDPATDPAGEVDPGAGKDGERPDRHRPGFPRKKKG